MHIGIATLHYGFNEGAVLQAYALARLLERQFSTADVEVLDQRYPAKLRLYGPPANGRQERLQEAIDTWLPLSPTAFRSDDEAEALTYAQARYRALFVGSDVVWALRYVSRFNQVIPGGLGLWRRQSNPFFPAFPNLYWPGPDVDLFKASYAASIGMLEWKTIPRRDRAAMRRTLEAFDMLSVRDERTLRFLDWLSPDLARRTALVPDPTLGLDLLERDRLPALREHLAQAGVVFERPRLGVICGDHRALRLTADALRREGTQVVGITTPNRYSDIRLFEQPFHPMNWALLFGLMDGCIVERMHGAIFCIKNGVPFVALDKYETEQDNDSKMRSLMRRFGLERYCVSKQHVTADELQALYLEALADDVWAQLEGRRRACYAAAADYLDACRAALQGGQAASRHHRAPRTWQPS